MRAKPEEWDSLFVTESTAFLCYSFTLYNLLKKEGGERERGREGGREGRGGRDGGREGGEGREGGREGGEGEREGGREIKIILNFAF